MRFFKAGIFLLAAVLISCGDIKTVQIWTDRPEFAIYADYFNNVQNKYKVSVRYKEFPTANLGRGNSPDIIVASWLNNSSTPVFFKPLNNLFGSSKLSRDTFYPQLLSAGMIDRKQYLLPISFNIPALIFSKDRTQVLSNQFTIDFDEIKELSKIFNVESRGEFTRMGFSPLWNDDFLFTVTILGDASFREANPLAWNSTALDKSIDFINNWTNEINNSIRMDEDFYFKFFIQPPERLIQSGRIFFSYIESDDLFLLSEDIKNDLDFRWIMEDDKIPILEEAVYMGIPRWSRSRKATEAFILWFLTVENQRRLMEYSRNNRINENIFGISGGFSALSPVMEQVYPLFYPELLGRKPPSENFLQPNILPGNWVAIKERVIFPYLHDRTRVEYTNEVTPLEYRLTNWMRLNR